MSYIGWRKDNEEKYRQLADDGSLELFPAFKESSHNDLSSTVVGPIVDGLIDNKEMSPIHFACVFAEYLYETYNVAPVDLELFTQYIIGSYLAHGTEMAKRAAEATAKAIYDQRSDSDEPEDAEGSRPPGSE